MALRVVFAEGSYLVREGVARLLETQPELDVVAVCGNLTELLDAVDKSQPDIVGLVRRPRVVRIAAREAVGTA